MTDMMQIPFENATVVITSKDGSKLAVFISGEGAMFNLELEDDRDDLIFDLHARPHFAPATDMTFTFEHVRQFSEQIVDNSHKVT